MKHLTMTNRVRAKFDRVAANYEMRYEHPRTILDLEKIRRLELLLEWTQESSPSSVLELGCGGGRALSALNRHLTRSLLVGSDISDAMLRESKDKNPNRVTFVRSSAEQLAFQENSFDLVFALGVVDYLQEPYRFFCDAWRILKPSGHLIFTYPNRDSLNRRLRRAYQSLRSRTTAGLGISKRPKKRLTAARGSAEINTMLVKSGFSFLRRRFITYGNGAVALPWSHAASRKMEDWLHDKALGRHLAWSGFCVARKNANGTTPRTNRSTPESRRVMEHRYFGKVPAKMGV